jgi:hypothetical protein
VRTPSYFSPNHLHFVSALLTVRKRGEWRGERGKKVRYHGSPFEILEVKFGDVGNEASINSPMSGMFPSIL